MPDQKFMDSFNSGSSNEGQTKLDQAFKKVLGMTPLEDEEDKKAKAKAAIVRRGAALTNVDEVEGE